MPGGVPGCLLAGFVIESILMSHLPHVFYFFFFRLAARGNG